MSASVSIDFCDEPSVLVLERDSSGSNPKESAPALTSAAAGHIVCGISESLGVHPQSFRQILRRALIPDEAPRTECERISKRWTRCRKPTSSGGGRGMLEPRRRQIEPRDIQGV